MRRQPDYVLAQRLIRLVTHLFFGFRVEGAERIPQEGPFLLACNHKSYLDPPLLGSAIRRQIRYFAKKELWKIPLFGPLIAHFGAIPVDRHGFDRRGVTRALELLEAGQGLLVFPEGTRIRRPGLAEPREGVGLLALRSGAPVVPAYIASSWEPRRRLFRRIPVRIRIGDSLHFGRADGPTARARYSEVAAAVMEAIRALAAADPAQNRV